MIPLGRRALRAWLAAGLLAVISAGSACAASAAANPDQVHPNVVYGTSPAKAPLRADVYTPAARTGPAPVLVIVHGGGFDSGDKAGESQYSAAMASVGFVTVNVNYTLSTPGSAGYPDQVREIRQAIGWTIAHAGEYGGDPHRLALVGFSAGGYLAAMGGLLDSGLPGRPIKAVVTLSAPLDLPAIVRLLHARVAACGYRTSCPQLPLAPRLSAFGTLFDFLGCPQGNCSDALVHDASPSSHVTAAAPDFLIYNSTDELMPRGQATDMGNALRAAGVPAQVVIVPGSEHGEGYLPEVAGNIEKYLAAKLGIQVSRLVVIHAPSSSARSAGFPALLVACCALAAAGSFGLIVFAVRRRAAARG